MCCYDNTKTLLILALSQVINSRQNGTYSLHFTSLRTLSMVEYSSGYSLLYRVRRFVSELFSTRVTDDWRSECGRRQKRVYNYTKIEGARFKRNYIVMRTWHINLIIVENKPHAHHKTYLHTIKVYNNRQVSLF